MARKRLANTATKKRCSKSLLRLTALVLQLCICVPFLSDIACTEVSGATAENPDIGCYEYGYTSPTSHSFGNESFSPEVYGENSSTVYYVSTNGNDSSGNGSKSLPWRTPTYAASRASAGSIIHITAGTYTINTTISLPVGVSIEGDGSSTVLTSTALTQETGTPSAIVSMASALGSGNAKTNGSQHISHIRFDGNGVAAQAIDIRNRNNVSVHDCTIVNFHFVGVGWRATDTGGSDGEQPPAVYVTGGRFYNNYMKDNSFYGTDPWNAYYEFARGALFCGGLKDFRIYGNTIIEDCRTGANGRRGCPIKFWYYTGWMLGCKIHDNTIQRLGSPVFSNDSSSWAFAIESSHHAGIEVYSNNIIGAIDLNSGRSGAYGGTSYEYATWIHDNSFTADPTPKAAHGNATYEESAIILERRNDRAIIERNTINGYNQVVYFNINDGISDIMFRYNLCTNLGGAAGGMFRVDGFSTNGSPLYIRNLSVCNNVFMGNPSAMNGFGIIISQEMSTWSGENVTVANNIIANTYWNWLVIDDYSSIANLRIENNLRYATGGEYRILNQSAVSGYSYINNTLLSATQWNSLFDPTRAWHPSAGSMLIDSGTYLWQCLDLDGNAVPRTNHTHNWSSSYTTDFEPTCTSEGRRSQHCTICGTSNNSTVIPALGHSYTSSVIAPTCTADGYTAHSCTRCGNSYQDSYKNAVGHRFGAYETVEKPTSDNDGMERRSCSVCGFSENKVIPRLGSSETSASTVTTSITSAQSESAGAATTPTDNEGSSSAGSTASGDSAGSSDSLGSTSTDSSQAATESNTESNKEESKSSAPIIIAISAGTLILLAVVFLLIRKKRKNADSAVIPDSAADSDNDSNEP